MTIWSGDKKRERGNKLIKDDIPTDINYFSLESHENIILVFGYKPQKTHSINIGSNLVLLCARMSGKKLHSKYFMAL